MSHTEATLQLPLLLIFSLCLLGTRAFSPLLLASSSRQQRPHFHELHLSSPASSTEEYVKLDGKNPSEEWELDCYSRPVIVNGKKLWEVLITDSTGSFRYLKTLPSNQVNSRELRKVVEQVMEERADEYGVKPTTIRFFRGAMFNMVCVCVCVRCR
jgi:hypothetical protein